VKSTPPKFQSSRFSYNPRTSQRIFPREINSRNLPSVTSLQSPHYPSLAFVSYDNMQRAKSQNQMGEKKVKGEHKRVPTFRNLRNTLAEESKEYTLSLQNPLSTNNSAQGSPSSSPFQNQRSTHMNTNTFRDHPPNMSAKLRMYPQPKPKLILKPSHIQITAKDIDAYSPQSPHSPIFELNSHRLISKILPPNFTIYFCSYYYIMNIN
jgi:hypothetical protein